MSDLSGNISLSDAQAALEALGDAGLTPDLLRRLTKDVVLASATADFLQTQGQMILHWSDPFGIYANDTWRPISINTEIRNTPDGIEIRQLRCGQQHDHFEECWNWREITPTGGLWRTLSMNIRLKVEADQFNGERLVSVMVPLKEAITEWTTPWTVDTGGLSSGWIRINDVTEFRKSPYGRGILVRRAVSLYPEKAWATPTFYRVDKSCWHDIALGLQVRASSFLPETIEVRQSADYRESLMVEPHWTNFDTIYNTGQHGDYHFEMEWSRYGACGKNLNGLVVTGPDVHMHIKELVQDWLLVSPTLRVKMSSQGYVYVQQGSHEPAPRPQRWTPPVRFSLSQPWNYLGEHVRARVSGRYREVEVQTFTEGIGWTTIDMFHADETHHDLTPGVRAAFAVMGDEVRADVQYTSPLEYDDEGWATTPLLIELAHNIPGNKLQWVQAVPGLRIQRCMDSVHFQMWTGNQTPAVPLAGSEHQGTWSVSRGITWGKTHATPVAKIQGGPHANTVLVWPRNPDHKSDDQK